MAKRGGGKAFVLPDPRDADFFLQAAERTRRVLEITKGRAFCLFTSYNQMNQIYEIVRTQVRFPLLLQGTAPRKALLEEVWGLHEDTDTRAIDNFIVRLRRYIEDDPASPTHLVTVRGVGYRFLANPQ